MQILLVRVSLKIMILFNTWTTYFITFSVFSLLCRIIFQKIDIISDAIIAIAAILKLFFYQFFVTLQSMTVPNFMSKAFFYRDLRRGVRGGGGHIVHDQTKIIRVLAIELVTRNEFKYFSTSS